MRLLHTHQIVITQRKNTSQAPFFGGGGGGGGRRLGCNICSFQSGSTRRKTEA